MSPLLAYTSDYNEHTLRETAENPAVYFKLTPEEGQELLPSGHTAVFDNRVGWAKMHLLKAKLLKSHIHSMI
jgi:restriction system protein